MKKDYSTGSNSMYADHEAVSTRDKENELLKATNKELLDMLNEIRDCYWDLMTRETTDKIDAAIQKANNHK